MAQAGIHALVGTAIRKWVPKSRWLMLGLLLGNIFPDMDNIAVALATMMKKSTDGLLRTITHSVFTLFGVGYCFHFFLRLASSFVCGKLLKHDAIPYRGSISR